MFVPCVMKSRSALRLNLFESGSKSTNGALSVTAAIITAVWGDEEGRPAYDVFVNFDSAGYQYHGTTLTHSYPFLNEGTSTVRVAIQIAGASKTRNAGLTIWESSVTSL